MGAPFRELFAELPAALFDALKGIGEEAVRVASVRAASNRRPSLVSSLVDSEPLGPWLCERYGWNRVTMSRCAATPDVKICARLACGHVAVYRIPEQAIEDSTNPAFSFIRTLDHATQHRPCSCVPREVA